MATSTSSLLISTSLPFHRIPNLNPKSTTSPHLKVASFARFQDARPRHPTLASWSPTSRNLVLACSSGKKANAAAAGEDGSSTPAEFRHMYKEVPERFPRWPLVVALIFLACSWRAVLWELGNWKNTTAAILGFFASISKLVLAFVISLIGDPVTGLIRCIEFCFYTLRHTYTNIVAFAPVPELTRIIFFSSTVLAIAEAVVPDAVSSQQLLLSLASIVGFGAVTGYIPAVVFWLLLPGFFCYSYFVKKRDVVSAVLPSAMVLAAVGEPWVRCLMIGLYLALAINQHSKSSDIGRQDVAGGTNKPPVPLQLIALSIGIHIAAKWVRHRHLTWMIV